MLTPADYAAVEEAIWSHPTAIDYMDKINRIDSWVLANGNPCCNKSGGRYIGSADHWVWQPPGIVPKKEDEALFLILLN